MRELGKKELTDCLRNHRSKGFHVDKRLMREVISGGKYYLIELKDKESFLSLIWQEIDASRLLTPKNESRCLKDVANRFIKKNYSFTKLSNSMGLPPSKHNPKWFQKCNQMYQSFDYEKFGVITVVPANDIERAQSPEGTFYVYDGIHKSLVLAVKLLEGYNFNKVKAVLLIPRRD